MTEQAADVGGELRRGNLTLALIAGIVAAVACGLAWGAIAAAGYHTSLFAFVVGIVVGIAVRAAGRSDLVSFGVTAAVLAVIGTGIGYMLAGVAQLARGQGVGFFEYLESQTVQSVVQGWWSLTAPLHSLFYLVAALEAFQIGYRRR